VGHCRSLQWTVECQDGSVAEGGYGGGVCGAEVWDGAVGGFAEAVGCVEEECEGCVGRVEGEWADCAVDRFGVGGGGGVFVWWGLVSSSFSFFRFVVILGSAFRLVLVNGSVCRGDDVRVWPKRPREHFSVDDGDDELL